MASSISNYAKRMGRLSSRIFGEVARPTPRPAFKVVKLFSEKPINKKPSFYDYYPRHVELTQLMNKLRFYGLFSSVTYGNYKYPTWAILCGLALSLSSMLPILIIAVYKVVKRKGTLGDTLWEVSKSTRDWGPADHTRNELYKRMKLNEIVSEIIDIGDESPSAMLAGHPPEHFLATSDAESPKKDADDGLA